MLQLEIDYNTADPVVNKPNSADTERLLIGVIWIVEYDVEQKLIGNTILWTLWFRYWAHHAVL